MKPRVSNTITLPRQQDGQEHFFKGLAEVVICIAGNFANKESRLQSCDRIVQPGFRCKGTPPNHCITRKNAGEFVGAPKIQR